MIMYARVSPILYIPFVSLLFFSCQEKRNDRFEREAKEYTERYCPKQLDQLTTLDSMVYVLDADAGNLIQYYTLNLTDEQRVELMDKLGEIGDQNLRIVRNSVLFAKQKEAGVCFSYIYYDAATGNKIAEYHFTPQNYK